ncbi:hypothetical protein Xoosp13_358 [Xanthomonas phage Xoo-sp13]|nr:hypothetical protein Xoosp13_358 [Xanthomonas phage Xoo-sp13]
MDHGAEVYRSWAKYDKTIIMFDGINSGTIRRTYKVLEYAATHFGTDMPHSLFCEDTDSLDGAATCCAIVVPDHLRQFNPDIEGLYNNYFGEFVETRQPVDSHTNDKFRHSSIKSFAVWLSDQRLYRS